MEKIKKFLLIATAIMLLTATFPNASSIQLSTENDLGIQPIQQRKDTKMLCLQGCPLTGSHAWDIAHPNRGCVHDDWYCVRASIAMINHYYGGNLSQDRISYYEFEELHRNLYNPPETDLGHSRGLDVGMAAEALSWALNNVSIEHQTGKPLYEQIVQWINSGRPIMRTWGAHYTVIDGYDGQYIHVINPWTGIESKILYDDLDIYNIWIPPSNATARNDEPTIWQDSDNDGICDFDEINRFFTDPYSNDTDGDGIDDKTEIRSYTFLSDDSFDSEDIRKPDVDNDGLRAELDFDSDDGGTPDGFEDLNHNGKLDAGETDPFNATDDPYQMPIPSFDFIPETLPINESITFNATASYDPDGNIVNYTWDFGDGNITSVTEPIINHTYSSGGNYTVTLNVTDNDGIWSITSKNLTVHELNHDIAVINVEPSKTVVCQGYSMKINVTVATQGDLTEIFNLTVYWNSTEIDTEEITLTSEESTIITFEWNTTGFDKGNYTIKAIADQVPGETDTGDNTFTDGTVKLTIVGDVNGDKIVDIFDCVIIALAFGSIPDNPNWNPNADINNDSIIDIFDLVLVATHYGETCP